MLVILQGVGRIAGVTPEETRERLLDAAARVFELKGYEGATVAQIAREAGVSSGAIYAHYASKAELLADDVSPDAAARFALMLGLGSMLVRALDLPATDPDDWTTFIRRLVGAFTPETTP